MDYNDNKIKQIIESYYKNHIPGIKEGCYLIRVNFYFLYSTEPSWNNEEYRIMKFLYLYYMYLTCIDKSWKWYMNYKMKYSLMHFEYDIACNAFGFNTQKYLLVTNSKIIYNMNLDDDTRNSGFYYYYYYIFNSK